MRVMTGPSCWTSYQRENLIILYLPSIFMIEYFATMLFEVFVHQISTEADLTSVGTEQNKIDEKNEKKKIENS